MQPTKAITVVIVALILTGMCGYLLQPTHEEHSVTKYDYKGDLTPSVLHEQIDDWVEYNPLTNVTGWDFSRTGVDAPISQDSEGNAIATPYVKDPVVVEYTSKTTSNIKYHNSSSDSVSNPPYPSDTKFSLGDRYFKKGVNVSSSYYYSFSNITMVNNMVIQLTNGASFWYTSAELGQVIYWGSSYHGSGYTSLLYNADNQTVVPAMLNEKGYYEPVPGERPTSMIHWFAVSETDISTGNIVAPKLTCLTPVLSKPVYIDSTKFVSINPNVVGDWANNQVNGIVKMIVSKNTLFVNATTNVHDYVISKSFTKDGVERTFNMVVNYNHVEGTKIGDGEHEYTLSDPIPNPDGSISHPSRHTFTDYEGVEWTFYAVEYYHFEPTRYYSLEYSFTTDGYPTVRGEVTDSTTRVVPLSYLSIPQDIPYEYVLCTLDYLNGSYYCNGLTSITNTVSYTVSDYSYALEDHILEGFELSPVTQIKVMSGNSATIKVYVDSTTVAVDPVGILWGNPTMPLKYFFPEQTMYDSRVLFNGFVKYGSDITVNGHTFNVVDGHIVYTHEVVFEPEQYPMVAVTIGERYEGMPIGNVIFNFSYYENMYAFPTNVPIELTVTGGLASGSVILPNGLFSFSAQLVSGVYQIVGEDETGQEYKGNIGYNQTEYPITLAKTSGSKTVTEYLPLKGMAIDFVKIPNTDKFLMKMVFTEAQDFSIDLGELDTTPIILSYEVSTYNPSTGEVTSETKTINTVKGWTVTASGNWYWQSGIYTISTATEDNIGLDWTSGTFGLTMSGCCFLMLLFMILGSAAVFRFSEEGFTFMDWVVLGGVSILLIGVAVMG